MPLEVYGLQWTVDPTNESHERRKYKTWNMF